MVTTNYNFRLLDKHIGVIEKHRAVLEQDRERKVTRTEALEDILNKFKEAQTVSPLLKVTSGLERFIHG